MMVPTFIMPDLMKTLSLLRPMPGRWQDIMT